MSVHDDDIIIFEEKDCRVFANGAYIGRSDLVTRTCVEFKTSAS